jgi:predicted cupin superfamily sugar epimerase
MFQNYSYPTANSDLIRTLNLQLHPEGGYYAETDRSERNFEPDTDGKPLLELTA